MQTVLLRTIECHTLRYCVAESCHPYLPSTAYNDYTPGTSHEARPKHFMLSYLMSMSTDESNTLSYTRCGSFQHQEQTHQIKEKEGPSIRSNPTTPSLCHHDGSRVVSCRVFCTCHVLPADIPDEPQNNTSCIAATP